MNHIKNNIPLGLTGFVIVLASRASMGDSSIQWFDFITASIAAIIFILTSAFFDIHPMFNQEGSNDENKKENGR